MNNFIQAKIETKIQNKKQKFCLIAFQNSPEV